MFGFLMKLFSRSRRETRCSRFGGVKAAPFSPADYDAMKRLERARDAAWARAKSEAEDPPAVWTSKRREAAVRAWRDQHADMALADWCEALADKSLRSGRGYL